LSFDGLFDCWSIAIDRHENASIASVPLEPGALASLMLGQYMYRGKRLHLFSNHQQTALQVIALHFFHEALERALDSATAQDHANDPESLPMDLINSRDGQ
jgi:hypothetical protein